ncbi:hypothetical protein RF11_14656 [Thelohanellus kitauei]|uniref:Uncharacterized protein n=1 Tax=Thelohanellus kitauei TaxID=669202 RepID=A0A0C2MAM4_THEKT|nr:hypothetical protein RF11_14656 [Thelohanellus kitauei]
MTTNQTTTVDGNVIKYSSDKDMVWLHSNVNDILIEMPSYFNMIFFVSSKWDDVFVDMMHEVKEVIEVTISNHMMYVLTTYHEDINYCYVTDINALEFNRFDVELEKIEE